MLNTIRYAFRMFRKNSVLSVVAILTISLGIGANTAIFSIVNSVLIQPLPYPESDRLFTVHEFVQNGDEEARWITRERYIAWQRETKSFDAIAALHPVGFNVRVGKGTQRVQGAQVSSNFFSLVGVTPVHGRLFSSNDFQTAILDYNYWQNNFGADPDVVGRSITIDNKPYVVAGILPKRFDYHYHQDVWIPLHFTKEELQTAGERSLHILTRVKRGISLQQAQAELSAITSHLHKIESAVFDRRLPRLIPLQQEVVGDVRDSLVVFQIAVGFVLLIVCVNMTNLVLAQSSTREKEISIRLALGSGRRRLFLQFITESLLLSFFGGSLGIAIFVWTRTVILPVVSTYLPFTATGTADLHVLVFAVALSAVTGLLIGLIPAIQLTNPAFIHGLHSGMRNSGSRRSRTWRTMLVIAEVALSFMLLIGAGLMINSFWRLQQVNPGFDPYQILKLRIALPEARYPDPQKRLLYYRESLDRLKTLPGVESVAMINWLPLSRISNRVTFRFSGYEPTEQMQEAELHVVTPEYFRTMRIPLRKGRQFEEQEGAGSRGVVIVTETLVRRYIAHREPLGQVVHMEHKDMSFSGEIIGVVVDVRNEALDVPPQPAVYVLSTQSPWQNIALRELVVRARGDAASLADMARDAIWAIDRDIPVYQVQPMTGVLDRSLGARRFNRNLISTLGVTALMLVLIGVYGLMSYSVTQRTREIGVRMALGAQRGNILRLVLEQGFKIAVAGIIAGIGGAIGLMNLIEKLLFDVSPLDPLSFAIIAFFNALTILAASYLPARKASNISPLTALRHET